MSNLQLEIQSLINNSLNEHVTRTAVRSSHAELFKLQAEILKKYQEELADAYTDALNKLLKDKPSCTNGSHTHVVKPVIQPSCTNVSHTHVVKPVIQPAPIEALKVGDRVHLNDLINHDKPRAWL